MYIDQLIYFIEVAKSEHLTHASENLNLSQPALSSSISKLEAELDVKLFDRKGRNIRLNPYGEAFLPYAQTIIDNMNNARTTLANLNLNQNKLVKLQTSHLALYPELLPKLLSVETELSIINSLEPVHVLVENLLTKRTDFCLTFRPLNHHQLSCEIIERHNLYIGVSTKNPLAKMACVTVQDIWNETIIVHSQYVPSYIAIKTLFNKYSHQIKNQVEAISFNDAFEYVAQDIGIIATTLPAYKKISNRQQEQIRLIPLCNEDMSNLYQENMIYWRKNDLTEKQKKIKDVIIKQLHCDSDAHDI